MIIIIITTTIPMIISTIIIEKKDILGYLFQVVFFFIEIYIFEVEEKREYSLDWQLFCDKKNKNVSR